MSGISELLTRQREFRELWDRIFDSSEELLDAIKGADSDTGESQIDYMYLDVLIAELEAVDESLKRVKKVVSRIEEFREWHYEVQRERMHKKFLEEDAKSLEDEK